MSGPSVPGIAIDVMTARDLPAVLDLWRRCEGLGLGASDEPAALEAFLARNPGLSFTARRDGELVGAVLGGHDGRRGYLHHLAVARACRRQGIGRALVERCCAQLRGLGLEKCHVFVYADNPDGRRFWEEAGYALRRELTIMSRTLG